MRYLNALFIYLFLTGGLSAAPLKVGVTAGPHAMILEKVKELAKQKGLNIQIVEFNDFILPNVALNDGEIDINSYQHQPFLDEQVKSRGYKIKSAGKTVLMPMGIYSKKLQNITDIGDHAQIAIPNDPTNGGRALKLLESVQLIKIKPVANPSVLDITENPKNLKIVEIDAPQVPRTLEDVDAAVINTDWVLIAGLDPTKALVLEDKNSPYANVIAVREGESRPQVTEFKEIYQSDAIKDYINQKFKGAVIPAW